MPQATISTEPIRKDLKSAPPDGFVVLRRMSYGKYLMRQEMALKLKVAAGKNQKKDFEGELGMANKAVTVFEFKECVVDHNLTNADGSKLDFAQEYTLEMLDPRIGDEIGTYINELHMFDPQGNSTAAFSSSSEEQDQTSLKAATNSSN